MHTAKTINIQFKTYSAYSRIELIPRRMTLDPVVPINAFPISHRFETQFKDTKEKVTFII